ncbi:pseudouridine synthase [Nitratireductor aquimarinus]|uniref:pseudouridine synthase n=1 Tax=Nitratireductor aquimarinus TaxID=889300 RepID=UPI00398E6C92
MTNDRSKDTNRPQDTNREDKPQKSAHRKDAAPQDADRAGTERIAKRLARAGVASRRDAEAIIEAGRVSVNGKVLTTPAFNVGDSDRILLDGEPLPAVERTRLFLFHKPGGVVTTNRDPEGRKTIFDTLPEGLPRLITVGRLDINTEGLLVLTNDGGLARALELPETGWLRRYRVRVHGKVDATALEGLKDGIAVDGVFYGAIEASLDREQGSNAWLTLGLREGKNREVKNVLGALGLEVTRLIRISYGPFQLGALAEGEVQEVKGRTLREQLGERLVEKAGANFDAPITTPFSNKPVRAGYKQREAEAEEKQAGRERDGGKIFIKNRKRDREDKREAARDRLQTRPARREEERGPRQNRGSHVWMAPGARPLSKKKQAEAEAAGDQPMKRGPKPGGAERGGKPFRPRGDKPYGQGRPDRDERSGGGDRPRFARGDKPYGQGRPERDERSGGGDKPRFSRGGKPSGEGRGDREDRPFRPRGDKPFGKGRPDRDERSGGNDRPRFSRDGKPSGEGRGDRQDRPFRSRDDRPASGDKPRFAKGGKPGGKSFGKPGGKPGAGKSFGKPGAGKPGGAPRPGKGRPAGKKPGRDS